MLTWSYAADALGFRLTGLQNSLVPGGISFGAWRLGTVVSMLASTRAEQIEYSEGMPVVTADFADLDNWTLVQKSAVEMGGVGAYELTTRGIVDQSAGVEAITLKPKLVVGAWAAPVTILRCVTYEWILPPIGGDASTCRIMVPGMQPEIWAWNDARLAGEGRCWGVPGGAWPGGEHGNNDPGDTAMLPYDEPKGSLAFDDPSCSHEVYLWNNEETDPLLKVALCARFTDPNGGLRTIRIKRDGAGNLTLVFTFACQDCSIGTDGNSDTDWAGGIQLRPMVGEDYDALRWCAAREIAEGWDWVANGPIGTNPNLSRLAEELVVLGYAQGGQLLSSFEPYFEAWRRAKDDWGLEADELAVQVYNFERLSAGRAAPTAYPFKATAAAWIQAMHDYGLGPVLYEVLAEPQVYDPVEDSGLPTALLINDSVIRTRTGYTIPGYGDLGDLPITGESPTGADGADEGNIHYRLDLLDPAANQEYLDHLETVEHQELAGKKRGHYADIWGWDGGKPNDNPLLDPAERSVGSPLMVQAERAFRLLERQRMAAAGVADPALIGEFVNPATVVGLADLAYVAPIYPAGGEFYGRTCSWAAVKYSRYIRLSTFFGWGAGPGPKWAAWSQANWANQSELHLYSALRWFMEGLAFPLQRIWNDASEEDLGFIVRAGEAGYLDFLAEAPFWSFVKSLYVDHKEVVKAIQTRGQKLRELASSLTRRAQDYEIDGVDPVVPAAKAGSGIWHLAAENCVVIAYGNWSRADQNPATVPLADQLTLAAWPELGAAPRDCYLWDWRNEAKLPLPGYNGSSYSIGLSLPPEFRGLVLMVPEGEEPPFMGWPSPITADIEGDLNEVADIQGDGNVVVDIDGDL